ncbi:co-regulatory protein PtrA N-terminal domain-containing protein [Pseudomonas sp.]|jgi:hypothetical protein|uniref:co-regulatory protein PtrA N-terminal domain-containing protein n=1 Tax=Pseudomonas sp. TaxID=306 RepID=UPI002638EB8F|nr:co-regulatory protein PtrA N-terminal domain-containing protein [Pseudomonas sp.]
MKTFKALFIIALLGTSVGAMAADGGDRTQAQMLAHTDTVMQHYQQEEAQAQQRAEHAKAVVSTNQASDTDRSE